MRKILVLSALIAAFLTASTASAQGFWEKKEWRKWSAAECKRMLEDSPWARRWAQAVTQTAQFSTRNNRRGSNGTGDEWKLEVYYIVELLSAQPIREALVRQQEIREKYDSMDEKRRAEMDQQDYSILNRAFDDVIVVRVLYGSNVSQYDRALAGFWQSYPTGTVPQEAFLDLSNGKKVPALRLQSPRSGQNEFDLTFPRIVDGELALAPDSKILGVEFYTPTIGKVPGDRLHIEFKPDKMKFNGAVAF